jgi:thioredoxin reductase
VSHLHDCLIVGGGAAGLNAALVLGRARRDVVLLDAGRQSNLPAHAVGGLIAQEGTAPAALYAAAHAQLEGYPSVRTQRGEATAVARRDDGTFDARLAGGGTLRARRILLATGMDYVPPDLPGIAERWGDAVFHCPFCHGWEVRDRPLAVLGTGEKAVFTALLLSGWSDDVVLVGSGFEAADRAKLQAAGIVIDERSVVAVAGERATLVFADGSELPRDGVLVGAPLRQRSTLAADLGVELEPSGTIAVDRFGRTSVDGVFAAGDVAGTMQMVAAALGAGGQTGAFIHTSLLAEAHDLPFPPGATKPGEEPAATAR